MPNASRQPATWTPGAPALLVSIAAVAALLIGFFVLAWVRHYGPRAMLFAGVGAVLMVGLGLGQWRAIRRRPRPPP